MQILNKFVLYLSIIILFVFHKNTGSIGLLCYAFIFVSFIHLYFKNLTYAFVLCLVIIANPGRIFSVEAFGMSSHLLRIQDLYFYLSFLCGFSPRLRHIKISNDLKKVLPVLIAFTLYQIIVSLIFKLDISSPSAIIKDLERLKMWIFGVYVLFPTYKIIQYDSKEFIKAIINLALIFACLAIISAYTPFKIIDFNSGARFDRTDLIRTMIQNSEIFKVVMFIAFGILLINYSDKKFNIYLAGILTLAIPIMGLFRLEIMFTFATMAIVYKFVSTSFNIEISKLFRVLMILIFLLAIFFISFPKFSNGIVDTYISTFDEVSGKTAQGSTQTRTIIELPKHLQIIRNNPVLGVGFRKEWWRNYENKLDWGLSDIPITSTLAMYGVIGMFIYYLRFYFLISGARKVNRFIKENRSKLSLTNNLEIATMYALGAYFITMVSFRLFYIGWELTIDKLQFELGVCIGLLYGLINNLRSEIEENEASNVSSFK